jgi:hypothetical protein
MSWEAGFSLAPAFGADADLAPDVRGLRAPDVAVAFGSAVRAMRTGRAGCFIFIFIFIMMTVPD